MSLNERESLEFWRRAVTGYVRSEEADLTARQQAVLMTVALTPGPHTVRGLAAHLDIAKPAVTRALDALERVGLVCRRRDQDDLRSVFVERTSDGMAWLHNFARLIVTAEIEDQSRARPHLQDGRVAA